jgi:hypothetical protein
VARSLDLDVANAEGLMTVDRSLVRFYLPAAARWIEIRKETTGLGELITDNLRTIARENPDLNGVIDRRDFNATEGNQRILDDETLARLVDILSQQRLGLRDVQPDLIGRAYVQQNNGWPHNNKLESSVRMQLYKRLLPLMPKPFKPEAVNEVVNNLLKMHRLTL